MKTAAIILNYNDVDTTIKLLDSIKGYSCLDAIIVVDNASTDDSALRLKNYISDNMILVEANANHGYGAGNNLGIRYAKEMLGADYALIANPDTVFSEDCISELIKVLKRHKELALIAPVMTTDNRDEQINIPGSKKNNIYSPVAQPLRPWLYDLLASGPISRRLFVKILGYNESYFKNKSCVYVDTVPGSLLLVDIDKFLEAGGYDEEVFLYAEEYILGHELKNIGYKSALLLRQSYIHRHSSSISKRYKSLIKRQKLRIKSTLHYYAYYLGVSRLQLLISKLFFVGVNIEIWIASRLGIL